jgi:hypothetical protein
MSVFKDGYMVEFLDLPQAMPADCIGCCSASRDF